MSKGVYAVVTVFCFVLGLSAFAVSQEAPKPGPEHKALDFFAGDWEFMGEMKPGPMGPGGKIHSNDKCEWWEGGFVLVCRGEGTNPNGSTKTLAMMSYDTDKKAYTYYGVETGMPAAHAMGKKDGDSWHYTSEMGGMKTRVTIKQTSATSYDFTFEATMDGSTWMTVMEGSAKKSST